MRLRPRDQSWQWLGFAVLLVFVSSASWAVEPNECDSTNGPCDCQSATQLPAQSTGVTGYATASNDAPIDPDGNEDSCVGVGQCAEIGSTNLGPNPDSGRTSIQLLGDDNPAFGDDNASAVVGVSTPNPAGLAAALANLDSYRVSLCSSLSVTGVDFFFDGNQAADYRNVQDAPPDALGPYEWIDFFVVLELSSGDTVVAYEQHGIDANANAPLVGSILNPGQPGTMGGRTIFFEQEHEITDLTFYFDGSGGFAYFGGETVRLREASALVLPEVCEPSNGPCDCDDPEQLPLQLDGVTGFATLSTATDFDLEDSCAAVGQCVQHAANEFPPGPGRTSIRLAEDDAPSAVIGDTSPNPAGLAGAISRLESYRVSFCEPVSVSGVTTFFLGGQEADFSKVPGAPPDAPTAYEWFDFFVVVTLANGDQVIAYEQHGADKSCGDPGGCNAPLIGSVTNPNSEGLGGDRTLFFDQEYAITDLTFFFDGSTGFAYFGGSSVRVLEAVPAIAGVCDASNGPCDCDPATQLPNQSDGVTGYAALQTAPSATFDRFADSCAAVGQCLENSPNNAAPGPGRTAHRVATDNASSAVIADRSANPAGLASATAQLESYRISLCEPLTVSGVSYNFLGGQEATMGGRFRPYEWLDFFVVVTDPNGDNFIAYEQHGVDFEADGDGDNAPDIGAIANIVSPGTQGEETLFFEQSFQAKALTFYFDASTGFAYWGGSSIVLAEAGTVNEGVCDDTNGPCSCDPATQLPLQTAGVNGYATTSNESPSFDENADSCAAVGQCLENSPNELPNDQDDTTMLGRTAVVQTTENASSMVIGDTDPNPEGLADAVQQLDFFSVEVCEPVCVQGVNYVASLAQEANFDDGPYTWLDFFVVLTLANGDEVIAFEQHGILTSEECDGDPGGCNSPIIGSVSNSNSEGTQGAREIVFEQTFEITRMRLYYDSTSGFSYWGGSTVEMVECPGAGLRIAQSANSTTLDEDSPLASDSYTVVLGQAPTDSVDVEMNFDDDQILVTPDSISFDEGDWFVEQTLTVTVVDDSLQEEDPHTSLIVLEAFGGGYTGVTASVVVTISDNDSGAPTGSCCLGDESCADVTEAECLDMEGSFQGSGVACDEADCSIPSGPVFRRGDCDQSGKLDFNDAIFHLRFLFLGENEAVVNSCRDACDSDDSGDDDFTDDINSLEFLFLGQGAIPVPGPLQDESHPCGEDPSTEDEATCVSYTPTIACP